MKKRVFITALILTMTCLSLLSGCNEESHTPSPAPIPSASESPAPNPTSSVSGDDQSVPTMPPSSPKPPVPTKQPSSPHPTLPNQGGTSTPDTETPPSFPQLPTNPPSTPPETPDILNPAQPDVEPSQPTPPTTQPEDSDQLPNVQPPSDQDPNTEESVIFLMIAGRKLEVELFQNSSTAALVELLKSGDISYFATDYGGFEKVGSLGQSLPTSNSQITAVSGDVILYSANQIVIFYGSNTWSYTRLGKIKGYSSSQLQEILSSGNVEIIISLKE